MYLTFRRADASDFADFYRVCYQAFGYDDRYRSKVHAEWIALLSRTASVAAMIVEECPLIPFRPDPSETEMAERQGNRWDTDGLAEKAGHEKKRVVAYQQVAFVTKEFCEWVRRDDGNGMPPYVNIHLAKSLPDGASPLAAIPPEHLSGSRDQMRGTPVHENGAEELRLVVTHYGWDVPNLTSDEAAHVRDFMRQHFAFFHRGYRLEEILIEVIGDKGLHMAQNAGFRLLRDYHVSYYDRGGDILPPAPLHPYLLGATRADVQPGGLSQGTVIEGAFAYLPARLLCVLTPFQHELLLLALSGADDAEIAAMIGISRAGVKRRWLDLYRRLYDHYPDLFPTALEGTRLAEGRRRLLNYVRDTPGELRPVPFPEPRRSRKSRPNTI